MLLFMIHQDEFLQLTSAAGKNRITSFALQWVTSYFKGRSQADSLGSVTSASQEFVTDFPQGSVLGLFLCPVYTSPSFQIPQNRDIPIHLYADDTQLTLSLKPKNSDIAIKK